MSEHTANGQGLRAVIVSSDDMLDGLVSLLAPCGVDAAVMDPGMASPQAADAPALAVVRAAASPPVDLVRGFRGGGARVVTQCDAADAEEVRELYRAGADVVFRGPVDVQHIFLQCCSLLQVWAEDLRLSLVGQAQFDGPGRRLLLDRATVRLTEAESKILAMLVEARSAYVSREAISRQVFRIPYDRFDRRIDVHVSNLRKKLRENSVAAAIDTSRLNGFRLVAETPGA